MRPEEFAAREIAKALRVLSPTGFVSVNLGVPGEVAWLAEIEGVERRTHVYRKPSGYTAIEVLRVVVEDVRFVAQDAERPATEEERLALDRATSKAGDIASATMEHLDALS